MAGKKKKKPVANPARGFATVSQPSKPKNPVESDDESSSHLRDASFDNLPKESRSVEHPKVGSNFNETKSVEEMTPAELEVYLEDAELQNFAEQHAQRVKAEAKRQVSKLNNERRQSRQQADQASIHGLNDGLIDDIIQHSNLRMTNASKSTKSNNPRDLTEDELLQKLWMLQEVLKHLKVNSLDEALTNVLRTWRQYGVESAQNSVWGLEDAFSWYAAFGGADENSPYDSQTVETDSTEDIPTIDAIGDDFPDSKTKNDRQFPSNNKSAEPFDAVPHGDSEVESSDENDDPDDLVDHWLRLQSRLFEKQQSMELADHETSQASCRKLVDRIKRIERDILFDTDLAQQRWQAIRRDLEIESGRARKKAARAPIDDEAKQTNPENSVSHEDNEVAFLGSIFDGADADDQLQLTVDPAETSVHQDFGSWNGVNPQRLLGEACTGLMARDGIRFRPVQTTLFSTRSHLCLHFLSSIEISPPSVECVPQGIVCEQSPRRLALKMTATTTPSILQSDAYVATIAMFLLISTGLINAKIASRLPKVWKELLGDLDRGRHELELRNDIRNLKHLRGIIHASLETSDATQGGSSPKGMLGGVVPNSRTSKPSSRDSPDHAEAKWSERAASTAFASMQPARQSLPVYAFKSDILHAFHENPILIICADTGAGKSTQIPSYVLEDRLSSGQDYRIMVTQPRRISAISIARRVSSELGEGHDALGTSRSLVGYAIRMESKVSHTTKITFVTTGVLLRMLQESPNLDHLNCLILDEVHERTMDLDLLFIALRRLRKRRGSLKIVLMSATVDATKFSSYFDNAPILNIPGRTFPVQVGFLEDAVEATLEVKDEGQRLEDVDEGQYAESSDDTELSNDDSPEMGKYSLATRRILAQYDNSRLNYNIILRLAIAVATKPEFTQFSQAVLVFVPGISEIRRLHNLMLSTKTFSKGWVLRMLHSSFSTQDLEKVFLLPPPGYRKIVIATNIAETGITIPDITAVIDTCKEKIMRFDERRQISRLTEGFIARASARQRKGRAARVQDGLCFHLVTRRHFEEKLQEQSTPEILRLSLQDPILRVKVWGLGPTEQILSEALDPPSMKNIRRALAKLQDVGALDSSESLTPLGRNLAKLPLDVAMGKMAILGILLQSLDAIITIIASFSTKSIFVHDSAGSLKDSPFTHGDSDLLTVYNAYSGWRKACQQGAAQQFSQKYHLNQFQLRQLEEQKIQLCNYLADAGLMPLSVDERATLQHARNSRSHQNCFDVPTRFSRLTSDSTINAIIGMAFYPKLLKRESQGYRNVYSNQQLQIAPTSINKGTNKPPEWLCYLEATQTKSGRLNAFHTSRVSQAMLILLFGQADFRYFAGIIDIDHGRIRLSLRRWREIFALQHLRFQVYRVMQEFLAKPESPLSPTDHAWLDVIAMVLDGSAQPGVHLSEMLLQSQQR